MGVVTDEQVWVELDDGIRLHANLYLPEALPAPVLLEALPYRKDDLTSSYAGEYRRLRDEGGYVVARVDLRGTGSSEGIATDEYPEREQRDLCAVIEWLAAQKFCTGAVGMYGTSYSGFNSIQVAMERPTALKAICAIYATDDRYTDDVHFEGGALRALDFIDYVLYMTPMNALPPVPSIAGDAWREHWLQRMVNAEPWLLRWLSEQNDGPYWRHGSLRPHYDAIEVPVMIVAGWADGYRNATFRMYERLAAPKRLLIGPWPHASTETGLPGPHIDLVPEMIRWWDRWLKGLSNGVDDEPPIRVFVRRSTRPEPDLETMRGEWRSLEGWPVPWVGYESLALPGSGSQELVVRGDVGTTAHLSCAGVLPWGQPEDQRPDEAFSLVYDFERLDTELEILGYPRVELRLSADAPVAFVSAKLCDARADGTSALVARGFLNLTHRDSHEHPEPLQPGRIYNVEFDLSATSWVFERGNRVRLDIAGTDWPNVWSPPAPVTLTLHPEESRLVLPVASPPDGAAPEFNLPREDGATKSQDSNSRVDWLVDHDILKRETRYVVDHGTSYPGARGARAEEGYYGAVTVSITDPGRARAEGRVRYTLAWPEVTVATEVRATLISDAESYHLDIDLDAFEAGEIIARRKWTRDYPRNLQ